jgi:hypothetical protein
MQSSNLAQALNPDKQEIILRHLDRIVESPVFRQSKRSCRFLRYVVSATLDEKLDTLRERSLGVELFGRSPDYIASEDAVVRVAAAEVRKRLAQFYDLHGVQDGLRLDLPVGGYQPDFRWIEVDAPLPAPILPQLSPPRTQSLWWKLAFGLTLLLIVGFAARWSTRSAFEKFWAPVISARQPVLVALGLVEGLAGGIKVAQFREKAKTACATDLVECRTLVEKLQPIMLDTIPTGDAVGLARLMSFLGREGKDYRVRGVNNVSYSDIKENDSILVAYFSNPWTLETLKNTRFRLSANSRKRHVVDQQRPGFEDWAMVGGGWPLMNNEVDFAIITRLTDAKAGKTRIVIGGFSPFGTEAALTLAASEAGMNEALSSLPSGWERRNVQIVLKTTVAAMMPGPPEIMATHSW